MSDLTENEILDRMATSYRASIKHCHDLVNMSLGKLPGDGAPYKNLFEHLKLIEGCCEQMTVWRQDARWLGIAKTVAHARQISGNWLRLDGAPKFRLFSKLAEALESGLLACNNLRDSRTGVAGAILPKPREAPHRARRPVQVLRRSPGGLLLPPGYAPASVAVH